MTLFCLAVMAGSALFIFRIFSAYQEDVFFLEDEINRLEGDERDLAKQLEETLNEQKELANRVEESRKSTSETEVQIAECEQKLKSARQREEVLELEAQKAQFRRGR